MEEKHKILFSNYNSLPHEDLAREAWRLDIEIQELKDQIVALKSEETVKEVEDFFLKLGVNNVFELLTNQQLEIRKLKKSQCKCNTKKIKGD